MVKSIFINRFFGKDDLFHQNHEIETITSSLYFLTNLHILIQLIMFKKTFLLVPRWLLCQILFLLLSNFRVRKLFVVIFIEGSEMVALFALLKIFMQRNDLALILLVGPESTFLVLKIFLLNFGFFDTFLGGGFILKLVQISSRCRQLLFYFF